MNENDAMQAYAVTLDKLEDLVYDRGRKQIEYWRCDIKLRELRRSKVSGGSTMENILMRQLHHAKGLVEVLEEQISLMEVLMWEEFSHEKA